MGERAGRHALGSSRAASQSCVTCWRSSRYVSCVLCRDKRMLRRRRRQRLAAAEEEARRLVCRAGAQEEAGVPSALSPVHRAGQPCT